MNGKMIKDWLIRTRGKKILGPVSKNKIIELVRNRSLSRDDEICAGNGFWFLVSEREYLERHLFGDISQKFNPITEAPDTISVDPGLTVEKCLKFKLRGNVTAEIIREKFQGDMAPRIDHVDEQQVDDITVVGKMDDLMKGLGADVSEVQHEEIMIPDEHDLEYPDIGEKQQETKSTGAGISVASAEKVDTEKLSDDCEERILLPSEEDLKYPDIGSSDDGVNVSPEKIPVTQKKKVRKAKSTVGIVRKIRSVQQQNDVKEVNVPELERHGNMRRSGNIFNIKMIVMIFVIVVLLIIFVFNKWISAAEGATTDRYSTGIQEKISRIFVPVAAAQVKINHVVKKKPFEYLPIITSFGVLSGNLGLNGFTFNREQALPDIKCTDLNNYYAKFAICLHDFQSKKKWYKKLEKDCSSVVDGNFLAMVNYDTKKIKTTNDLNNHLIHHRVAKKRRKKIVSLFRKKKKAMRRREIIDVFNRLVEAEVAFMATGKRKDGRFDALAEIEKFKGNLVADMSEMMVAVKSKNTAWAKRNIRKILHYSPEKFIFDVENLFFKGRKDRERYLGNVVSFLWILEKHISDSMLFKLLVNYISLLHDVKRVYDLKMRIDAYWTLEDILGSSRSFNFGRKYTGLWLALLLNQNSSMVPSYVKSKSSLNLINEIDFRQLWIYSYYPQENPKWRSAIIKRIRGELVGSVSSYERQMLYKYLEDQWYKKEISKFDKKLKKPISRIEYEFYRGLLGRGIAIEYSIYNLLLLGDKNENYFWWMIL
ncbi:MAG: hypothetical protein KAQ98_09720 [Bacteriovoracaceae bacterium]|nr:hypothetical protein [Bacteriovoracaceae bacterium]